MSSQLICRDFLAMTTWQPVTLANC